MRLAWLLCAATVVTALAARPAPGGHGAGALVPSYTTEHVKRMLDAGEALVLVDVRPLPQYRAARLPGARSVPLPELTARIDEVPRSGRVILYGDSIVDAHDAYTLLQGRGYRNVGVLEDGFAGWLKRGSPVER